MTLRAGLINIPLQVFTAVESTSIVRKEFLDGNPDISVGRVTVRKDTDAPIDSTQVTRMAQADDGTWVVLTDDEINDCVARDGDCEVVTFVPIASTDQYLIDGMYQVRVKKTGHVAFSLLLTGMKARKVHALVRFALRGTPRYGLLTVEGDLLLIATADAVRTPLPIAHLKHSKAERAMITSLIDAIGVSTPVVLDDVAPKVQAFVNNKAKAPIASTHTDILEVLLASIEAAKARVA